MSIAANFVTKRLRGIFLSLYLPCECYTELVATDLPYVKFISPIRITWRSVSDFMMGCPCVWCRGLTTCPQYMHKSFVDKFISYKLVCMFDAVENSFSYTLGREYRVIRKRYSRLLFTSKDRLCANLRVQEQSTNMTRNASISRSRDVTDPLWWRHNAKSETTVLGDNCEMSDRWLCVQNIK